MPSGLLAFSLPAIAAASLATGPASKPEARILAGESASVVLGDWCAKHNLPALKAPPARTGAGPTPRAVLSALSRRPGERVAWRHVDLVCGRRTLSRADNWYLPDRLTKDMNRRLATSRQPFGLVVRPLAFTRRTLAARRSPSGTLEVRAVLVTRSGVPFSYVIEHYAPAIR